MHWVGIFCLPDRRRQKESGDTMRSLIIPKRDMTPFVASLQERFQVVAPIAREDKYIFAPLHSVSDLRLDYDTTILPPKNSFLPQKETLFTFELNKFAVHPMLDSRPRVLLGAHTCDIHAMKLLDNAFAKDYRDAHYFQRRDNTLIVGIECLNPCNEYSFCKSMGTLSATDGYDLHLTDLGDDYYVDVATERGEKLIAAQAIFRATERDDIGRLNQTLSEKWTRFVYKLEFDSSELPALMAMSYKSRLWEELGNKCLGCGQCTIVCPTCYCFNVKDEVDLNGACGARNRTWDCCQLEEFARVATGENFRKSLGQRQRHRFFRKAKYLPDMFGELGCVGCGRCARSCLVHITPVQVFNTLHAAKSE
jgi:sulfhydrogenase subunit beta (sulfur reductase)